MAANNYPVLNITHREAFLTYQYIEGPKKRQLAKGFASEDYLIAREILEASGVELISLEWAEQRLSNASVCILKSNKSSFYAV